MLLLCGALAGVLTLMRAEYLAALVGFAFVPLVAVFGQAPVPRRTRLLAAGLVLVGGLGVTAPWVLRNAVVMDRPIVTSDFWGFTPRGYTMWVNSWIEHPRHVLTTYNRVWPGGLYERSAFPDYAFRSAAELDTVEQLLERRIGLDLLGSEEDERFAQLARERTAAATMASFVVRPIKRIVLCWFYLPRAFPVRAGSVLQTVRGVTDLLRPAVLSLAAAALSLGLLLCGLAGAVVTLFERRPLPLAMTVILGLRLVVVGWLVLPVPRYVIQAVPAVAVLPLFLAGWLWRRLRPTTGLA